MVAKIRNEIKHESALRKKLEEDVKSMRSSIQDLSMKFNAIKS